MGKVESGGNHDARNAFSGAYGKYQILPANWPSWAAAYLGNSRAQPTPANQDTVAAGKFTSLYRSLGAWRRVAYWWLTGSSQTSGWSSYARGYVERVMRVYEQGGAPEVKDEPEVKVETPVGESFDELSDAVVYTGTWQRARHQGYGGDRVRYTTEAGATATFSFIGRKVTWYGPLGATRGEANVYIDGMLVRTVDQFAQRFDSRAVTFKKAWVTAGAHTLTIEVLGTGDHPMVAIDEFLVTQ
ncbi:MAG: hypothetical protein ABIP77_07020 [Candidatus Limnocylindrales bacterium]